MLTQAIAEYAAQQPGAAARAQGAGGGGQLDLSSAPLWLAALGTLVGLWLLFGKGGALQRLVGLALLGAAVYFGAPAAGFAVPW